MWFMTFSAVITDNVQHVRLEEGRIEVTGYRKWEKWKSGEWRGVSGGSRFDTL